MKKFYEPAVIEIINILAKHSLPVDSIEYIMDDVKKIIYSQHIVAYNSKTENAENILIRDNLLRAISAHAKLL